MSWLLERGKSVDTHILFREDQLSSSGDPLSALSTLRRAPSRRSFFGMLENSCACSLRLEEDSQSACTSLDAILPGLRPWTWQEDACLDIGTKEKETCLRFSQKVNPRRLKHRIGHLAWRVSHSGECRTGHSQCCRTNVQSAGYRMASPFSRPTIPSLPGAPCFL